MKDNVNTNQEVKYIDPNPEGTKLIEKMYNELKTGGDAILKNAEHKFNLKDTK